MFFILLGFGVSLIVKHREKTINLFLAIAGYGLYYLFEFLGSLLIEQRLVPAMVGVWLPNIVIGTMGTFLIIKYANSR